MRMGGSDRQLADVVAVLETQGPALDHDYMDRWAPDLGVENLLQRRHREGFGRQSPAPLESTSLCR